MSVWHGVESGPLTCGAGVSTLVAVKRHMRWRTWTRRYDGGSGCPSSASGRTGATVSANCIGAGSPSLGRLSPQDHPQGLGGWHATPRSTKPCAMPLLTHSGYPDSHLLRRRHACELSWYVTRMPSGVTGTAREGLPMSIQGVKSVHPFSPQAMGAGPQRASSARSRSLPPALPSRCVRRSETRHSTTRPGS